jgi:hypothetical protein
LFLEKKRGGQFQASFKLGIAAFIVLNAPDSVILRAGYFEANFKK